MSWRTQPDAPGMAASGWQDFQVTFAQPAIGQKHGNSHSTLDIAFPMANRMEGRQFSRLMKEKGRDTLDAFSRTTQLYKTTQNL